jgi:hypothetical protein
MSFETERIEARRQNVISRPFWRHATVPALGVFHEKHWIRKRLLAASKTTQLPDSDIRPDKSHSPGCQRRKYTEHLRDTWKNDGEQT